MSKVLYLIPRLGVGGAERTLVSLVNNLDKRYEATILTLLPPGKLTEELTDDIAVRSVYASSKYDILAALKLVHQARSIDPDIIQSFLYFDNLLARISGILRSDMKVICGVRCVPENPSYLRAAVDRSTLRFADHIVSNSTAGADMIVQRGANRDQVSVIHNGRDISMYNTAEKPANFYNSFSISPETTILGNVGRLIERKGQYELLEAFQGVKQSYPNTDLLLIGYGPEREGLEQRAEELGIRGSVHFTGLRDDVAQLLAVMDVFVFPSYYEGLPGALIEAMAAGLPIVASDIPGNREVISDSDAGILVHPKSPDAIQDGIEKILSDPAYSEQLSLNAAAVAERKFSIESMVTEFETLYEQLLSGDT